MTETTPISNTTQLPQDFMKTLQWTGEYAADFHQAFSSHLSFVCALYFDYGRDIEMENEVVTNMAFAQTYASYLECKVHQYNNHQTNESPEVFVEEVIRRLYTPEAHELDLMINRFRALAYNEDKVITFDEIDLIKATKLSGDILSKMMPEKKASI